MATITDLGIPELGMALDTKRRNRWRVMFQGMGGGMQSQAVSVAAKSITRPTVTWQQVEIHRYNSIVKMPGKHSFEDINLVLEDDVTSAATAVIQRQMQNQQKLIGAEGQWLATATEASKLKFATVLEQLDGDDQVIERWICEGCFISNANFTDLDYTSGESLEIHLTIVYDLARQDIVGYSGGDGAAIGGAGT